MADYANVTTKVFIHLGNVGAEDGDVGTIARDINEYVTAYDSTNSKVLSTSHPQLNGKRIVTNMHGWR